MLLVLLFKPSCSQLVLNHQQCRSRSLSSTSFMQPGTTWVERGPDGRPYFVRRRLKLPSTRSLLTGVFLPRRSSFSLPRYLRKNFRLASAPVSTPSSFSPPTSHSESHFLALPAPHPASQPVMYPAPPHPLQENSPPEGHAQMLSYAAQPTFGPPGMYGLPPMPYLAQPLQQVMPAPAAQAMLPPRPVEPDDMRYKCRVCGRFRSARYHYKHPIPPGELPKATVCRRCRHEEADSEESFESTRTVSYGAYRGRSRSRYSDKVVVYSDEDRYPLTRSMSRVSLIPRGRSRSRAYSPRRCYRSSSLESELIGERPYVDYRSRRPRSPSLEVIERTRYIEDVPARPPTRETVYVEERIPARCSRGRTESVYEYEDGYAPPIRLVFDNELQDES